jgi:2-polyprenyl-3-methyl-5-hydroxy-6-metoxy-1,4-benzoquinol methylase
MDKSPASGVMETVPCFLCGADDYDVVYEARRDREKDADLVQKFRASGDELLIDQLVRCRRCGFEYVNPRLRSDLIFSSYTAGDDPTYVSQLAARERTFARSLGEIERAAGRKGKLLDIGTAAGAFIAAARAAGWDAEGCEPNTWLAEFGARHYNITIRQGSVFEQNYAAGTFDVVTLWDVIEHTTNPREMLEHCRTLLKPGGVLVVNYPDIGSWIARVLGRRWLFLTSVHLYYFTRKTMTDMLERAGFSVEVVRPHFQRLELDYILFRGSVLSEALSNGARAVVRPLGLGRAQVPYWLGQTFVLARRDDAPQKTPARP